MSALSPKSAFTLLEMLVATAVFAMLMMILLQMTSGLMSGATRMDENLKMEQDVRLFFDVLRRDLAQARIGTNQNQCVGTGTNLTFVSSSQRLKTNYVSDQRLVTYFLADPTSFAGANFYNIRRAVVDPTASNYTASYWNPLTNNWWSSTKFPEFIGNISNSEVVLSGVKEVTNGQGIFFYYLAGDPNQKASFLSANPARGVKVNFNLLTKRGMKTGVTNSGGVKQFEYDVDLNLPPVFNP